MDRDLNLLSLKWNNHQTAFIQTIKSLRQKASYADVTLACNGKFYPVHRLVLSTCSEYFYDILEHASCKNPIVVLKDVEYKNLEYLLDYMYIGEVNVKQNELASLVRAAEYLQIKGLAIPDEELSHKSSYSRKRLSSGHDASLSPSFKRKKKVRNSLESVYKNGDQINIEACNTTYHSGQSNHEKFEFHETHFIPVKCEPQSEDDDIVEDNFASVPESHLMSGNESTHLGEKDTNFTDSGNDIVKKHEPLNISEDNQPGLSEIYEDSICQSDIPTDSKGSDLSCIKQEKQEVLNDCSKKSQGKTGSEEDFICSVTNDPNLPNKQIELNHIFRHTLGSTVININNIDFVTVKDNQIRNYRCSKCSFFTNYKCNAKDHARVHTGEKPFLCQFCNFRTATQYALTQHTRLHTGEKPYKCSICSYEAKQLSSLKSHCINNHKSINLDKGENLYKKIN